jgi:hypothetical protein
MYEANVEPGCQHFCEKGKLSCREKAVSKFLAGSGLPGDKAIMIAFVIWDTKVCSIPAKLTQVYPTFLELYTRLSLCDAA